MADEPKSLVLFDGVCNFCNDAILFIIDRDPRERFEFASLQSERGQQTLREHALGESISTVALVQDGRAYTKSKAALRVAKRLRWPWPLFYVLMLVPSFVRDAAYDWFAARRYVFFGKSESCRVPTPELRRRFVS